MGWPVGVKIDGDSCHRNADSLWLEVQNTVIAASAQNLDSTAGGIWPITNWFNMAPSANTTYAANSSVMLTSPFSYSNPDFRPLAGSPVLTGAAFTNPKLGAAYFDQTPTYRGAFGATNWMDGWANFGCDTSAYTDGIGPEINVGMNDIVSDITFMEVYPNPAQNETNITFNLIKNNNVSFSISDLSGKVLIHGTKNTQVGRNQLTINTSTLASGLYIIKISAGHSFNTSKLNVIKL
jgi:hypothetical protein